MMEKINPKVIHPAKTGHIKESKRELSETGHKITMQHWPLPTKNVSFRTIRKPQIYPVIFYLHIPE